jgi:hypothetical protein
MDAETQGQELSPEGQPVQKHFLPLSQPVLPFGCAVELGGVDVQVPPVHFLFVMQLDVHKAGLAAWPQIWPPFICFPVAVHQQ